MIEGQGEFDQKTEVSKEVLKAVCEEQPPTGSTYTSSKVSGKDETNNQSLKSSASKLS